jgi:hypothetical protein
MDRNRRAATQYQIVGPSPESGRNRSKAADESTSRKMKLPLGNDAEMKDRSG